MPRRGENVYHRKDGLWEARYVKEIDPTGKRKYGSVYARTCREAKEKRQAMVESLLLYHRPLVASSSWTVQQLGEEWLKLCRNRLKPSTFQRYTGFFKNHICPIIGNHRVFYLNSATINDFANSRLAYGLSPRSVNSVLVFLHSILKYGSRQYKLPLPEIYYLSYEKKEMKVLTPEEEKRLVGCLLQDTDNFKLGILVSLYTGLRIGELCALQWSDIDDGCIVVRRTMQRLNKVGETGTDLVVGPPKTSTSLRSIPLPSFLKTLLAEFYDPEQQYVLGTNKLPIVEPRVMQYKFKKCLEEAQVRQINFHSLRHTFATRCVERGFEIKSLSEILGHANIQVTLSLYVHSSMSLKRSNMEKVVLPL